MAGRQGVRFLKFIVLIADEIVVAVVMLILLPAVGISVPLPLTGLILSFLLVKDILIAPYVLRGGLEKAPEVGPEALRGKEAIVVKDLSPEGLVKLDSELWRAKCLNGVAERGERVRVVGVKGTKLLVERRASEERP